MTIVLFLLAAVVLVALGGLFAAIDTAVLSLSRSDLLELAERARAKRSLRAVAEDPAAHLNAANFARVVFETTAAVLITISFAFTIDELWIALVLSAVVMTAVSFVLVGSSPRSVGRAHPKAIVRWGAVPVHVTRVVLGPLANALVAIGNRVTPGRIRSGTFSSEEQLLSMVDEATELEVLEEDDRELIHSILEFNDTVVREVMIPRTDMVTVDDDDTVGHGLGLFLSKGVSRMPVVVGGRVDDISGVLYLRDVARLSYERPAKLETTTVAELARPALLIPESKKVDDTLRQMQAESNHLAMVVDEYGGIAGLVTLEDLLEELVGDISDEYDRDMVEVEPLEAVDTFRVSARLPVDELGELFGLELDDDDVDTVGGLLAKGLGRLPETGDEARIAGLILTADRTEGRRKRLVTATVRRDPDARGDDDGDTGPVRVATGPVKLPKAGKGKTHDDTKEKA
ncbi:hemolysin family protein [Herbiconiux sp. KACC 21604]|uniref:hemolysin family protein n=1 Tax=unclassified Herbiconiux TaxID=2618217 RepID=UPI0014922A35|nr:hemolysin family protein [Herbiconiux sp. SALV-R1]QJU53027.1 HlyC/CorC family transporter [Herbiconiux sp. SALV-R1]WPO87962.1 hemolysin family protein [Herbiconiux sp. KACC 21604]